MFVDTIAAAGPILLSRRTVDHPEWERIPVRRAVTRHPGS